MASHSLFSLKNELIDKGIFDGELHNIDEFNCLLFRSYTVNIDLSTFVYGNVNTIRGKTVQYPIFPSILLYFVK